MAVHLHFRIWGENLQLTIQQAGYLFFESLHNHVQKLQLLFRFKAWASNWRTLEKCTRTSVKSTFLRAISVGPSNGERSEPSLLPVASLMRTSRASWSQCSKNTWEGGTWPSGVFRFSLFQCVQLTRLFQWRYWLHWLYLNGAKAGWMNADFWKPSADAWMFLQLVLSLHEHAVCKASKDL